MPAPPSSIPCAQWTPSPPGAPQNSSRAFTTSTGFSLWASVCSGRSSDRCIFWICHPDQSAAFSCERQESWQDLNSTRAVRCFSEPKDRRTLKPSSLASRKRPHQTNHKQYQNGSGQDYNNHGRTLQRTFYPQPSGQSSSLYFQRVAGRPYPPGGSKSTHLSPISLDISLVLELRLGPARLPKKAKTRENPGVPPSCFA